MNKILDFLQKIQLPKIRTRPSVRQIIFWSAVSVLALGLFIFVRGFTACWRLTSLPGIPLSDCGGPTSGGLPGTPDVNSAGTLVGTPPPTEEAAPVVQAPQWDGGSRINILFVGLRGGDPAQEDCPLCTDTLILLTVDPVTKTAGMLSIPRDMWVNIPGGFNYGRINTAWTIGVANKLPGGGPALTMRTVSQFIGVPVQYYVQVDFNTFVDLIDMIGGVDVYSDEDLILDLSGSGYASLGHLAVNTGVTIVGRNTNSRFVLINYAGGPNGKGWIQAAAVRASGIDALPVVRTTEEGVGTGVPGTIIRITDVRSVPGDPNKVRITSGGVRHLNGQVALAYSRCRDQEQGCKDGDVGRAKRQQKVIFAIRDKVFSPEYFPKLLAQAPELYNTFSAGIHTNMSLDDAIKLAWLAKDIPLDRIRNGVIDESMVSYATVTYGGTAASIFKPIPDKIRVLRDQIFTSSGPLSPLAQGDPVTLMRADAARLRVTNNTYTAQLDSRTGNFLIAQGMQVTELGRPTGASNQTVIVLYSPKLYTLRYLISTFGITSSNQLQVKFDPTSTVDVEVRLGNDWVSRLPAGY